jgi:MFS family permease
LRERVSRDQIALWGTLVVSVAALAVAFAPALWIAALAMVVAGVAWISTANTMTMSAQLALPNWVRARGMSVYQMALMGGSAGGAVLWGQVAERASVPAALMAAAALGPLVLLLTRRLSLGGGQDEDLSAMPAHPVPAPAFSFEPDRGPVMVTVEYLIDPADGDAFRAVMEDTRRARLRQGALSWGLFRDTAQTGRYIEYFVDESWIEHQRRMERFTAADVGLRDRRTAFHRGAEPPRVARYLAEDLDA